nr:hypothetical protein BaRGS_011071 [Batillaria attramentaria]KAG5703872.1 hypothetical protein BaRGS_031506 [Batillaria attramentaria]
MHISCPQQDDELLCDVQCPEGCRCQGLAFVCTKSFPAHNYTQLRYLDASGQNSFTSDTRNTNDLTIARRLTTIVLSDFLCWFPIGLLGLLASTGTPISGEVNVAMAIFVLPLNSALNPFLYTLNMLLEKRRKAAEARMLEQMSKKLSSERRLRNVDTMTDFE